MQELFARPFLGNKSPGQDKSPECIRGNLVRGQSGTYISAEFNGLLQGKWSLHNVKKSDVCKQNNCTR